MLPRDAYIARMEAQLLAWADELAWLGSKAALLATRRSLEFQLQIEAAKGEHQAVRHRFEGLKRSSKERWSAVAAGLESAWNELTC